METTSYCKLILCLTLLVLLSSQALGAAPPVVSCISSQQCMKEYSCRFGDPVCVLGQCTCFAESVLPDDQSCSTSNDCKGACRDRWTALCFNGKCTCVVA